MNKPITYVFYILLLTISFSAGADGIIVKDPWVRAAPPNAPALAAFMQLENHTDASLSVVDVRTSLELDRVELHKTQMKDGVMKMVPQKLIPVESHASTVLKPGSWHIMLIKPVKVPKLGETVELTLVFDNGLEKTITAGVRKGMKMSNGEHEHKMPAE